MWPGKSLSCTVWLSYSTSSSGEALSAWSKLSLYLKDAHLGIPIKVHSLFLLLMEFEHCSNLTCPTPYRVPSAGKPAVQSDKHCQGHSKWSVADNRSPPSLEKQRGFRKSVEGRAEECDLDLLCSLWPSAVQSPGRKDSALWQQTVGKELGPAGRTESFPGMYMLLSLIPQHRKLPRTES